jgi:hypothetical protein
MPYEDFTDRTWKITRTKVPDLCKADEGVVISGPRQNVKVECAGRPFLGPGEYEPGKPEMILAKDRYMIKLLVAEDGTYTLEADLLGDRRIGGAWTAEDNTPPGSG